MTPALSFATDPERVSAKRSSRSPLDSVLFYGVFGLLLFGPLAFGAVESWSISVLQVGAGLLFVLWAIEQLAADELELVATPLRFPILDTGFAWKKIYAGKGGKMREDPGKTKIYPGTAGRYPGKTCAEAVKTLFCNRLFPLKGFTGAPSDRINPLRRPPSPDTGRLASDQKSKIKNQKFVSICV